MREVERKGEGGGSGEKEEDREMGRGREGERDLKKERERERTPAFNQGLLLIRDIAKQLQNHHRIADYTSVDRKMGTYQKRNYHEDRSFSR